MADKPGDQIFISPIPMRFTSHRGSSPREVIFCQRYWLSPVFGEAKQIEHRRVVRGLEKLSQRPQNEAAIAPKLLQARYKQLLDGGSLLATNLDHQKLGRARKFHPLTGPRFLYQLL